MASEPFSHENIPYVHPFIPQRSVAHMIGDVLFARENHALKLRIVQSRLPQKTQQINPDAEHISLEEVERSVREAGYQGPAVLLMTTWVYKRLIQKILQNKGPLTKSIGAIDAHASKMARLYGVKFPEIHLD